MSKQIANHCLLTLSQGHPCEVPAASRETSRLQGSRVGCGGKWVVKVEGPGKLVSHALLIPNGNQQGTHNEYYLKTVVAPQVTPQRSSGDQMRVGAWEREGLARAGFGNQRKRARRYKPLQDLLERKLKKRLGRRTEKWWGWDGLERGDGLVAVGGEVAELVKSTTYIIGFDGFDYSHLKTTLFFLSCLSFSSFFLSWNSCPHVQRGRAAKGQMPDFVGLMP